MLIDRLFPSKYSQNVLIIGLLLLLATVAVACSSDSPTAAPVSLQPATFTPFPPETATLVSTPTPAPTPTPTLPSPLPSGRELAGVAFDYLTELVEELGPRESATDEELEAAEHLASTLENLGYAVELQSFTVQQLSRELSVLEVNAPQPRTFDLNLLAQTATGEVSGTLVSVGLAGDGDFPEGGVEGQIVVVRRGLITFEEKVTRAAESGAAAVVIYNNLPGNFQGRLSSPASIPAVSISRDDGQQIEELLLAGEVEATVSVIEELLPSRNVIAELTGPGDVVVILGGHYDTVADIVGANDNASGTAVLLTLAGQLAGEDLPFTVRFIAFGSEELGLRGSRHYVASLTGTQLDRIRAMFNFDALGSGESLAILGTNELTGLAEAQGDAQDINVSVIAPLQGATSDHQSFADAGIPVLMFVSDDFSRLHTPEDTLQFVEPSLLGDASALALFLLRSDEFLAVLK